MSVSPEKYADEVSRLRKIEGQVQGVRRMIEEGRYCVDILTQLQSVTGALRKVEDGILARHLRTCVRESLAGSNRADQDRKIAEILELLGRSRFRR
jgi:CsoR family transcriptional regulator, copper-sensing transcriptional repressor